MWWKLIPCMSGFNLDVCPQGGKINNCRNLEGGGTFGMGSCSIRLCIIHMDFMYARIWLETIVHCTYYFKNDMINNGVMCLGGGNWNPWGGGANAFPCAPPGLNPASSFIIMALPYFSVQHRVARRWGYSTLILVYYFESACKGPCIGGGPGNTKLQFETL